MPLPKPVVAELRRAVGDEAVIVSANDLRIFERDGSIEGALPDAVVLAASTEQVAAVMKIAARNRIPVVPRGAGTGLSGGAVTIKGGIALQVTRMRRILEVDPVAQTALVEPGVVNHELSLVVAQHGLFYAPDPSSQKACTIGGNAAENSGGPHCLYYGVTTNHVLGMEVVLADGSVHWVSGDTPDRIGLDLCGILVGSEGTLCAITKVKVKLLRIPPSVATMLAAFPTIETASQAVSAVSLPVRRLPNVDTSTGPLPFRSLSSRSSFGLVSAARATSIRFGRSGNFPSAVSGVVVRSLGIPLSGGIRS